MAERDLLNLIKKTESEASEIVKNAIEEARSMEHEYAASKERIKEENKRKLLQALQEERARLQSEFDKLLRDISREEEKVSNALEECFKAKKVELVNKIIRDVLES